MVDPVPNEEPIDAEIVPNPDVTPADTPTPSEQMPAVQTPGYTEDGVPTFGYVEHKVQSMLAKGEMDAEKPAAQNAQWDYDQQKRAGRAKLDEIRRSMREQ